MYKNVILSVVLCGREAGAVAVKEEQKSRELGKDTLRTIFELREGKHPYERETHVMRTFILVFIVKHGGYHVINYKRGRAFNMRRKDEKCDEFGSENLRGRRGK